MFRKIKNRYSRQSFYSDQLIRDNSSAHCGCELYLPYPSLGTVEMRGHPAVPGVGDMGLGPGADWAGKHCTVYLCEVPVLDSNFVLTLEDTGQDAEICLSVVLNGFKKGDIVLEHKEQTVYTFKQKVGGKWRTFILKLYPDPTSQFEEFQSRLEETLEKIVTEKQKQTYLLLAIPIKQTSTGTSADLDPDPESPEVSSLSPERSPSPTDHTGNCTDNVFSPPFDIATDIPGLFPTIYKETVHKPQDIELVRIDESDPVQIDSHNSTPSLPSDVPQRLESLLKSIEREKFSNQCPSLPEPPRPHVYSTVAHGDEYLNSEFLPTEELYVKMGTGTPAEVSGEKTVTVKNPKQEAIQKLAVQLQAAINERDVDRAQQYARDLASENVSVTINAVLKNDEDKEFSLKVYVEDKESSGLSIQLKVRASDTILNLKHRMFITNMFPHEVQRWIIGRRIPADTETLAQCKVRSDGNTAFLYLVSAKSVGIVINREEFMRQHGQQVEPNYVDMVFTGPPAPIVPADPEPVRKTPQAARPKEAKIPDVNLIANMNEPLKTPSKLGKSPNRLGPSHGSPNVGLETDLRQGKGAVAKKFVDKSPLTFHESVAGNRLQMPAGRQPMESEEEQDQTGWTCSACTFINQPTRPGCEVCTNPRPPEYHVPDDFVISAEEQKRLDMERLVEQQTKEVPKMGDRNYDTEQERDLDNLLRFYDAVGDTINKQKVAKCIQAPGTRETVDGRMSHERSSDDENFYS